MPSSQHIMREYHRQQLRVGGAEVEGGHLGGGVPAEGLVLKCGGLGTGRGLAIDERQMDRTVGVSMGDRRADAGIHDLECDLLAALARKSLAWRLARLDLAADELPVSAERLAERTLAEEIFVAAADYPADDFYGFSFHDLYYTIIGLIFGALLQIVENQFSCVAATRPNTALAL